MLLPITELVKKMQGRWAVICARSSKNWKTISQKGGPPAMSSIPAVRQLERFSYLAFPETVDPKRPTLLFLHGSGHSALFWERQLTSLATAANCLALDLPGHGRSSEPAASSVADHAAAVCEFLDTLGSVPVIPLGLSLGGAIVLWLLRHHPGYCRAGVIVNSGARLRVAPAIFEILETDYPRYLEMLKELALSPSHREDAGIDAILKRCTTADAAVTAADFRCCDRFDMMADVGAIDRPVLIMAAAADALTPLKYGEYLEATIPGARRVTLADAGHLSPLERPEDFNAALADFVASLSDNSDE
jgi:pimeloyl-ACP methyl ester carboxylesterase